MDKLRITGGRPLEGEIRRLRAKNAALPIMCAALLRRSRCPTNVPALRDVSTMTRLLSEMGVQVERSAGRLVLHAASVKEPTASYDLVKTMRAPCWSSAAARPLRAREGVAARGCAIGARPVDQHVKGLEAMGATIAIEHGYTRRSAQFKRRSARRAHRHGPRHRHGTENLMMAAALAEARDAIENAAREPEGVDLARCLGAMGAKIEGAGSDVIRITGTCALGGAQHRVMPDRIETGTYLAAAAATGGRMRLTGAMAASLDATLDKLREAGARIAVEGSSIELWR